MNRRGLLLLLVISLNAIHLNLGTATILDSSTVTVGNNTGFVLSGSTTTIEIFTADSSGFVLGADASIQIISPSGDAGIIGDGTRNETANAISQFGPSNETGYISLTWFVPTTAVDIPDVEIKVNVTHAGDTYQVPTQTVTITPFAIELTATTVTLNTTTVGPGSAVEVTFSSFSIDGGDLSNMQVTFNATPAVGSFTTNNLLTDAQGRVTTIWQAPDVVSEPLNISIFAIATTRAGLTFTASENLALVQIDMSLSQLILPDVATSGENTTIVVQAAGTHGEIAGADVVLTSISPGIPFNQQKTTNSTGTAVFVWEPPSVASSVEVTFQATISKGGVLYLLNNTLTLNPIIYKLKVSVNSSTVEVNQTVQIEVTVTYKSLAVIGATVELSTSQGGYFAENLQDSIKLTTDADGMAVAHWIADLVPISVIGSNIGILVEVYGNETGVATTTLPIHVNPLPVTFNILAETDKSTLAPGDEVTVTITVLNSTNAPYADALINIESLVGQFKSSNSTSATALTDSEGKATFTWVATGFAALEEPLDLNLTGTVSISEFNVLKEFFVTVTVAPANETGQITTSDLVSSDPFGELLNGNVNEGNFSIVLGGIIGIILGLGGAVFILLRRKG
ncbi:MAG: hypothetical protein D6732_16565 [Methanobacteriota archaeon]|nr:MAG: hypothetical protein D6732_16565 [Euryarchaeota archaeon]